MKQSILFLFIIILFSACKKSEDPTPSNSNNTTINTAPILQANLSYNTTTSTALEIDLSSKITDANGDTWSITNSIALHGTISISNKVISYTSNSAYTGNDTITISIQDSKGASSTGKIAIVVSASTPTNHAPTFTSTTVTLTRNFSTNILNNIFFLPVSDADGDNITITGISGNSSNITISNSGLQITVTLSNSLYGGVENLSITISDGTVTTTSNFIVNVGTSNYITTYNNLSSFLDRPLSFVTGSTYAQFMGTLTISSNGNISASTTQPSGEFYAGAGSSGTYKIND
ncbi:MAG: hypothetical protein RLZZ546_2483, partial [Bacteroidota bacterium]